MRTTEHAVLPGRSQGPHRLVIQVDIGEAECCPFHIPHLVFWRRRVDEQVLSGILDPRRRLGGRQGRAAGVPRVPELLQMRLDVQDGEALRAGSGRAASWATTPGRWCGLGAAMSSRTQGALATRAYPDFELGQNGFRGRQVGPAQFVDSRDELVVELGRPPASNSTSGHGLRSRQRCPPVCSRHASERGGAGLT